MDTNLLTSEILNILTARQLTVQLMTTLTMCPLLSQESWCPGLPGDLIVIPRYKGLYDHYAVNVGDGYLVHMTGDGDDLRQCVRSRLYPGRDIRPCKKARIKHEKCIDVVKPGSTFRIENGTWDGMQPLPVQQIISKAIIGRTVYKIRYNLVLNNCEHFARWCRYGEMKSKQADPLKLAGYYLDHFLLLCGALISLSIIECYLRYHYLLYVGDYVAARRLQPYADNPLDVRHESKLACFFWSFFFFFVCPYGMVNIIFDISS